jgi:hypothetical protein
MRLGIVLWSLLIALHAHGAGADEDLSMAEMSADAATRNQDDKSEKEKADQMVKCLMGKEPDPKKCVFK